MKRIITCILLALLVLSSLTAQSARFGDARRYFELGVRGNGGFSNNVIAASDIFQEVIVIDLVQLSKDLPEEGIVFSMEADTGFDLSLNLKNFGAGLSFGVETSGYGTIPKGIVDLLAEGNRLDETNSGNAEIIADVRMVLDTWFGTRVSTPFGKINLRVNPGYYVPLLHIADTDIQYSFRTNSDGSMEARSVMDIPVYTSFSGTLVEDAIENGDFDAASAFSGIPAGGLDLSAEADYKLFSFLTVGARVKSIPFIPAVMKNRTRVIVTNEAVMTPLLSDETDVDDINVDDQITTTESTEYVYDTKEIRVLRPFKLGVNAVYAPFSNKLLTLHPNLDLAVYQGVYADVGLKVQVSLADLLILKLSTNLEDRLWKQQAGIILNARVIELEAAFAGTSASFTKSFQGAGTSLLLAVRMGF